MARVRLDRADLTRVMREASRRELREASRQVVNRARILAPVRTGRLRSSIRADPPRLFTLRPSVRVGSDLEYAEWVHDGTRPHRIEARNKKALRFRVGGRIVIVKAVNHPGTKPRPFLDRALRDVARGRGYSFRADAD